MKKLLILIAMILVSFSSITYAQTTDEPISPDGNLQEDDTDVPSDSDVGGVTSPFTIKLVVGTQSPWTKKVPIDVVFTPTEDSSRTEVSWDAPLGITVEKNYDDYFESLKGQVYSKRAQISASQPGTYTIVANVTNWGYGTNVTTSEEITLTFGDDLIVTPPTPGYSNAVIIKYTVILIFLLIILILSVFGIKKGLKFLKKWLQPPQ
jgi:hypothetical protein